MVGSRATDGTKRARMVGLSLIGENEQVSDHGEHNREGLERLRRLASLSDADLAKDVGDGWTVTTVLGHLAFFDRMLLLRWDTYEKEGVFAELTPSHFDLMNYAGAAGWSALPPRVAVESCIDAAEKAVARIDALPQKAVDAALETNRMALLERIIHWSQHIDQIAGALGREI